MYFGPMIAYAYVHAQRDVLFVTELALEHVSPQAEVALRPGAELLFHPFCEPLQPPNGALVDAFPLFDESRVEPFQSLLGQRGRHVATQESDIAPRVLQRELGPRRGDLLQVFLAGGDDARKLFEPVRKAQSWTQRM